VAAWGDIADVFAQPEASLASLWSGFLIGWGMPLHRAGGKLTRSHTTLIDAAAGLIRFFQPKLLRSVRAP